MMEFPIPVSVELRQLCADWHSGQWSAMYSVSSTGTMHDGSVLTGLWSELRKLRYKDGTARLQADLLEPILDKWLAE